MRLLLTILLMLPPLAWSLEVSRLWLPVSYQGHYLKLKEAALMVETTQRCAEVLRGTLDLSLTTQEQPYYRILCRQADGMSYTEVVDGLSMQLRSTQRNTPPPETPQERVERLAREAAAAERAHKLAQEQARKAEARARRVAEYKRLSAAIARAAERKKARAAEQAKHKAAAKTQRLAQQEARAQARKRTLQNICLSAILDRTSMMLNLKWLNGKPAVKELENGQMRFSMAFDAEDIWQEKLAYKAVCTISTPGEYAVVVSPR